MLACTEIIKTVEARDDLGWSVDEPGYMAATLEKVFFFGDRAVKRLRQRPLFVARL